MLRLTVTGCVLFLGAFIAASATQEPVKVVPEAPPRAAQNKKMPALIMAQLSHTHATPGDIVRLTELVPTELEIRAHRVSHKVYVIGQYDFAAGALVNRDPEGRLLRGDGSEFADNSLHGSVGAIGNQAMPFSVTNPRQDGFEFSFRAKEIGIYWIKSSWSIFGSEDVIESNPVVLTVSPPLDKSGKPIIKEEWLSPAIWKSRAK